MVPTLRVALFLALAAVAIGNRWRGQRVDPETRSADSDDVFPWSRRHHGMRRHGPFLDEDERDDLGPRRRWRDQSALDGDDQPEVDGIYGKLHRNREIEDGEDSLKVGEFPARRVGRRWESDEEIGEQDDQFPGPHYRRRFPQDSEDSDEEESFPETRWGRRNKDGRAISDDFMGARGFGPHHGGKGFTGHGMMLGWGMSDLFDRARPWLRGTINLGPHINWQWDILGGGSVEDEGDWWDGPNVCHSREENENEEEMGDIRIHHMIGSMSCDQGDSFYKCTQTFIINGRKKTVTNTFECCHGFEREPGTYGCTRELELHDLHTTLEDLGLEDMVRGLDSVDLTPLIASGNYTIFAPVDGSFDIPDAKAMEDEAIENNVITLYPESSTLVDSVRNILASHIVSGFHKSRTLENEQILQSMARDGSTIRINHYAQPRKLMTANCVPIESKDQLAVNGVVHTVGQLLPPALQTVFDVVSSDRRLTVLKKMLARSSLNDQLAEEGSFTLIAPSDEAFQRLGAERTERILHSGQCLDNILKTHLVSHVICSSVIAEGRARTRNMAGNFLHLSRDESDKLFVEEAQVISHDIITTNGVIHIIDDVILSDNALNIIEVLEKSTKHAKFLELVRAADISLDLVGLNNYTLLLPTDQAIQALPSKTIAQLLAQPEELKRLLRNHVIPEGQLGKCNLRNGAELRTLINNTLPVRQFSSFPFGRNNALTVQCARLTNDIHIDSCNAKALVIDKVLIPPVGGIVDVLETVSDVSIFSQLLRDIIASGDLTLDGPYTVFAPTNQNMEAVDLDALYNDDTLRTTFVKSHIMEEIMCCTGIFSGSFGKISKERMLAGNYVTIRRTGNDNTDLSINGQEVMSCDLPATNGVIHILEGTLNNSDESNGEADQFRVFSDIFELPGIRGIRHYSDLSRPLRNFRNREPDREEDGDWPWWMRRLASARRLRD